MIMQNNELTKLPNIGKVLAGNLKSVGIHNAIDLISMGTQNAFIKLKTVDKEACYNTLCAIDGAILGVRWHSLDASRKRELLEFYKMTEKE